MLSNNPEKQPIRPFLQKDMKISQPTKHKEHLKEVTETLECKCCGNKDLTTLGKKGTFSFYECSACAFIFTNLKKNTLKETYHPKYNQQTGSIHQASWATSLEFLSPALAWMPDTELNIMDFGCGESIIPSKLRNEGHKVVAVDIVSPKEPHPDRMTGDIFDLDLPFNYFDLIYSYQVFEHISEPSKVLRKLFQLLKKDGKLLIHTDMETSERKNVENFMDWEYVMPPDHCSFYRHKTFEKMIDNLGHFIIYKNSKVILARKA